MPQKRILIGSIFLLYAATAFAQESITVAGGNASSSKGSVSYSVGQLVCTTDLGTNGSVTKGVQQPFEISTIAGLEETGINLTLSALAFPNPISDFVYLEVENYATGNLRYQLVDMQGNLLKSNPITDNQTQINTGNLQSEVYILNITNGNKTVKSFKLVKN